MSKHALPRLVGAFSHMDEQTIVTSFKAITVVMQLNINLCLFLLIFEMEFLIQNLLELIG